jgi:hypothetical protein
MNKWGIPIKCLIWHSMTYGMYGYSLNMLNIKQPVGLDLFHINR